MIDLGKRHDGYDSGRHNERQRMHEPNACMLHADAGEGGRGEQPALLAPGRALLLAPAGSWIDPAASKQFQFQFQSQFQFLVSVDT
jgi:hypothetical protein